jgi:hypothetical protein
MTTPVHDPADVGTARRETKLATPRMKRERQTMAAMLRIHCEGVHVDAAHDAATGLCEGCAKLLAYSTKRLAGCPFGPDKPTCANCQVHCYGPKQREAVKQVMRYAGPRMMLRHPVLALHHIVDGRRPAPPKPRAAAPGAETQPASDTPTTLPAK